MALTGKQKAGIGIGVGIAVLLGFMGVAHADEIIDEEPDPEDEDNPIDVFNAVYSDTPVPGKLYLVKKGDSLMRITQKALNSVVGGMGNKGGVRVKYMKCISSAEWNRSLYGKIDDFTNKYPKWTSPDNLSLRSMFYPRHQDARGSIIRREAPIAGINEGKYGLIWLPLVSKEALIAADEPDCANQQWSDGRSGLEPPQVLYDLWEKA